MVTAVYEDLIDPIKNTNGWISVKLEINSLKKNHVIGHNGHAHCSRQLLPLSVITWTPKAQYVVLGYHHHYFLLMKLLITQRTHRTLRTNKIIHT